ncbi:phosphatase PAP2 family protein [Spiroplasma culicicola]|uniref:Phosphatidic acid phosphatase type 2/haloperoxidase domain-containing protein n=1 Tax=Spiroplasma culicicola AES-1 TaxID=1276246 RepID=W6A6H6_9MOLU|nr:phosphatase PAP2 family protein [Spiroplasma culicicola]AHI52571.1 hypothetical protein SCULI_v1c02300 [Spiroplasma culicicola AES-1]
MFLKKDRKISNNITIILLVSFFVLFMTIFAIYDLQISTNIFNQGYEALDWLKHGFDIYGKTMMAIPIYATLFIMLNYWLVNMNFNKTWMWLINVSFNLVIILTLLLVAFDFNLFIELNWQDKEKKLEAIFYIIWYIFIIGFIAFCNMVFFIKKIYKNQLLMNHLFKASIYCLVFIAFSLITVELFKNLFGRPRPRNVLNDGEDFKYVFEINFSSKRGKSFPSGHTESAGLMLGLLFYCKKETKKQKSIFWIIFGLGLSSLLLTAASRVFILAHFTTDVTFSIFMIFTYLITSQLLVDKIISKRSIKTNG